MVPRVMKSSAIVAALVFATRAWHPVNRGLARGTLRAATGDRVLPDTSPTWERREFAQRGTRARPTSRGLLWRSGVQDRTAAATILRGVLDLQYEDGPDSNLHGVWRTRHGETEPDSNWREFIGCGLILILESFSDVYPGPRPGYAGRPAPGCRGAARRTSGPTTRISP